MLSLCASTLLSRVGRTLIWSVAVLGIAPLPWSAVAASDEAGGTSALASSVAEDAAAAATAEAPVPPALAQARELAQAGARLARAAFERAQRESPQDVRIPREFGFWLQSQREFGAAVPSFERLVELTPGDATALMQLGSAYGLAALEAPLFRKPGLAKRAREAMERAVATDPSHLGAREALMTFYAQAPGIAGGSKAKAAEQAVAIAALDPLRGAQARWRLAMGDRDWPAAEGALRDALTIDAQHVPTLLNASVFMQDRGRFDEAFAFLTTLVELNPEHNSAWYQWGRAAALSGRELDRAEAYLRRYLEAPVAPDRPGPAPTHWRLGQILEHRGDRTGARAAYTAAIAADPDFKPAQEALAKLK